jgi:hypothetical protein
MLKARNEINQFRKRRKKYKKNQPTLIFKTDDFDHKLEANPIDGKHKKQ